ncbi:uncharacterized protein EI90DRAFT_2987906 [Cantharellus anzutake]|uniref:uncharacterized protein n=1 Tax=Cantharellus anzutake TaxID=1750568 RepID=UPI001904E7A6|nr:uncharacterized protein EI90DRAFT_2987906 [Cantharellus anzutake]KAF8342726.1 hypothetical protein EI90DRAFT_2987906 [Cantharellus anzutake]
MKLAPFIRASGSWRFWSVYHPTSFTPVCARRFCQSSLRPTTSSNETGARPGTAPSNPYLLVLRTPSPSSTWPAHPLVHSRFMRDLSIKLKPHGVVVNVSHDPNNKVDFFDPLNELRDGSDGSSTFLATLYRSGHQPQVVGGANSLGKLLDASIPRAKPPVRERHIYVCTHGSRDCRCGTTGKAVFTTLRSLASSLRPAYDADETPTEITVREIGHAGGHKYAANVLDFPPGDVYGSLSPNEASKFFDALTSSVEPLGVGRRSLDQERFLLSKWRGRLGLTEEEQLAFHAERTRILGRLSSEGTSTEGTMGRHRPAHPVTLNLTFETHDGKTFSISAQEGQSIMQIAKANSVDGIEGTCGGNLECATCHLYVVPPANGPEAPIPPMSETEEDMLEYALFRDDKRSRLGCQITSTKELEAWCSNGGILKLPRF